MSKKVKVKTKTKKYRIKNWQEYNQSLVNRGNITIWLGEDIYDQWLSQKHSGKQGKPLVYADRAIETALMIREVFQLPLRQTEGFLNSIFTMMQVNLKSPDYSTLSLRGEVLPVKIASSTNSSTEPLNLVIDSTGIKVYGEGEWKVRQHGWSKHRSWRKLHLGVSASSQEIKAGQVTANSTSDSEALPAILEETPDSIDKLSADGAYDKRSCYQLLAEKSIKAVIPPQKNAKIWQHGNCSAPPLARDENLRRIRKIGRSGWKKETDYHKRSLAETCVFRLKTIFTDKVKARKLAGQKTELMIRCKALNKMTLLGMPRTIVVV